MQTIRVAGMPLEVLGPVSGLTWSTQSNTPSGGLSGTSTGRGGGKFWTASWSMPSLSPNWLPATLVGRQSVELMQGPVRLGMGVLSELDRDSMTFTATGLCQEPGRYPAMTNAGGPLVQTSVPDLAWDYAVSLGMPCVRRGSISTQPVITGDADPTSPIALDQLLDVWAAASGVVWWIDADGGFASGPDPTIPKWALLPSTVIPSTADDTYLSALFGVYISGYTTATPPVPITATAVATAPNAAALQGFASQTVDLTPLGSVTSTKANQILNSQLAADGTRWALTDQITATAYHLTTFGGQPAAMWDVEAGDMIRAYGVVDNSNGSLGFGMYTDFIAATVAHPDPNTAVITPRGFAPRDLTGQLTALTAAVQARQAAQSNNVLA